MGALSGTRFGPNPNGFTFNLISLKYLIRQLEQALALNNRKNKAKRGVASRPSLAFL
jgi:hypothetical protein